MDIDTKDRKRKLSQNVVVGQQRKDVEECTEEMDTAAQEGDAADLDSGLTESNVLVAYFSQTGNTEEAALVEGFTISASTSNDDIQTEFGEWLANQEN